MNKIILLVSLFIFSISAFGQKSQNQVDPGILKCWKFQEVLEINDSAFVQSNALQDLEADKINFIDRYNVEITYDTAVISAPYKYDLSNKWPRIIVFTGSGKEKVEIERFLVRRTSENELIIWKGRKKILYRESNNCE